MPSSLQHWYDEQFNVFRGSLSDSAAIYSAHALLLEVDIRRAFCAGAWVATITLCFAAIEATVRQIEAADYERAMCDLIGEVEGHWLRNLRNQLIHAAEPGTKSDVWKVDGHDIAATHDALEPEARLAVQIMFRAIYGEHARQRAKPALDGALEVLRRDRPTPT